MGHLRGTTERIESFAHTLPRRRLIARMLGQLRPLRIPQIIIEILRFSLHLSYLLTVLIENMFSDEVWTLELLTAERAQPLILR